MSETGHVGRGTRWSMRINPLVIVGFIGQADTVNGEERMATAAICAAGPWILALA
jgi:hypothetical protein